MISEASKSFFFIIICCLEQGTTTAPVATTLSVPAFEQGEQGAPPNNFQQQGNNFQQGMTTNKEISSSRTQILMADSNSRTQILAADANNKTPATTSSNNYFFNDKTAN